MFVVPTLILASIAVGALCALIVFVQESREPRLLCLMYHRLGDDDAIRRTTGTEKIFLLPAEQFEKQIEYLARSQVRFLSADQARQVVAGEAKLSGPAVMITFDDGCRSSARFGKPVLDRHNARATLFVTTSTDAHVFGAETNDPRLTDDEIRSLDSESMRIESHSVTHRPLSGLGEDEIRSELSDSRQLLETLVGRPIEYLAIPGNWFDRRVMRIAREVGYKAVWCSNPGAARPGAELFGIPRINIDAQLNLEAFKAQLSPQGVTKRRFVSAIKRAPGRLLGPRAWSPLQKLILRCIPGGHVSMRRMAIATGVVTIVAMILAIAWIVRS